MVKIYGAKELLSMDSANAETNSIFVDSSDNVLKFKNGTGISLLSNALPVSTSFSLVGKNLIRQAYDKAIAVDASGTKGYLEAYTDTNGRFNTFDRDTSDSYYDAINLNIWKGGNSLPSGDTNHDPDSFTNYANAFDGDTTTYASKSISESIADFEIGKTFSARTIGKVFTKFFYYSHESVGNTSVHIYLQTYNGSTWSNHTTLVNQNYLGTHSDDIERVINIDASVQGIRLYFDMNAAGSGTSNYCYVYSLEYSSKTEDSYIYNNIPTGTFSSSISKAFATTVSDLFTSGDSIQYKLTNTGGDDSGWLNIDDFTSFTAFSNGEPETLILKLDPSGSPVSGSPSLLGVWCYAE